MKELGPLLPFILIGVVFWFFLIRPQRRRQLELQRTQRSLQVGDEVMLSAGILGTVWAIAEEGEQIQVEVADGVRLNVLRGAIAKVLTPAPSDAEDALLDPNEDPGPEPPR